MAVVWVNGIESPAIPSVRSSIDAVARQWLHVSLRSFPRLSSLRFVRSVRTARFFFPSQPHRCLTFQTALAMDVTTKSPEHREEELPLSGEMDSDSERAYGTFEVSVIEVEPEVEEETKPLAATTTPTPPPTTRTVPPHAHRDHTCAGDCCALVSLVWVPFRWQTYKVMLFHVVSLLFALGASLWTIGFHLVTLPLAVVSRPRSLRDVEIASVHRFLTWDAQLFNWVAPETERVMVFNASPVFHDHDDAVYALYPQIYFGVAKLVCSSVPSIISVVMYVWSIQRFVAIVTGTGLPDAAVLSAEDDDLLILLSVVGIYASAVLMTTVATIARHITVFFCAEFLLYAS